MKILIVDDSTEDRTILRHYLAKFASVIMEAANGAEGFKTALSERPDLIISDALMPKVDGFEFLREVRLSSELRNTPFVFYSAVYGGTKDEELAMSLGADAFMAKPLEAEEFQNQLKSLLDGMGRTKKRIVNELLVEEEKYLRQYSQTVATKLEEKVRELELLHKSLEARVVEMVAEQRRKDQILIQQSRLAAMGEMIGNIAHQWRNPLNNVALIVQSVQMEFDSGTLTREEMGSNIQEVMEVLLHMSQTIDDFRNFFRQDKEKQEFAIITAVDSALKLVSATLKSHNIQVEIEADDNVTATGFQNEYAQVLINLISNSREAFTEQQSAAPHIFIRITRENGHSVLYIRDNAGGIPDEVMPKIFDPYFTTRGPDRGTGIGLYMSKMIIEQNMAGHLTARNVDGGAEFRIEV